MKIFVFSVALCLAFATIGLAQKAVDASVPCGVSSVDPSWHKYESELYVIEFPCTPDKLDKAQLSGSTAVAGWTQTSNYAVIEKAFDRSVNTSEAGTLLEEGAQAQFNDPKSKILEKRDFTYRGVKGKEIIMENRGNLVIGRLFVYRDRLFILSVNQAGNTKTHELKKNAHRFFESFEMR